MSNEEEDTHVLSIAAKMINKHDMMSICSLENVNKTENFCRQPWF